MHVGSFRVSVIHRALTWTTGSFTCVCDHSYACVYTQGLCIPTAIVSTTFLNWKNSLKCFLVLLTGFEQRVVEPWVRRSTNWATLSPQYNYIIQEYYIAASSCWIMHWLPLLLQDFIAKQYNYITQHYHTALELDHHAKQCNNILR